MQKIEFNIVPVADYEKLNEEQVCEFQTMITCIKEHDLVCIPQEFYMEKDCNNKCFLDIMTERNDSLIQLFTDLILKQANTDVRYEDIIKKCEKDEVAFAAVLDNYHKKYSGNYTICKREELPKIKRVYLKRYNTYKDFCERAEQCYPNLLFHEHCFEPIKCLGEYRENIEELDKNLSALNDFGSKIYWSERGNEANALNKLASQCSVICSGKGSNESKSFKIKYIQKGENESNNEIELTCNPHLKLFHSGTNKRIYFCWGRNEIENHKIIVARIGDHWR